MDDLGGTKPKILWWNSNQALKDSLICSLFQLTHQHIQNNPIFLLEFIDCWVLDSEIVFDFVRVWGGLLLFFLASFLYLPYAWGALVGEWVIVCMYEVASFFSFFFVLLFWHFSMPTLYLGSLLFTCSSANGKWKKKKFQPSEINPNPILVNAVNDNMLLDVIYLQTKLWP